MGLIWLSVDDVAVGGPVGEGAVMNGPQNVVKSVLAGTEDVIQSFVFIAEPTR